MSATLNEFAPGLGGTIRNVSSIEKNSRKLFGYDFVNYRSDCETSNANGLLKYNDVVNFGRRISDANVHNCVMCGEFDVVIPTQNKDVCKGCDSSFWYSSKLNVTFKFCKGCKNFVTLEMFSDKPDASKCCRCRRRGRENYLTKKFIGSQDMCVTPGYVADSPPNVSPVISADSAEDPLAGFKYGGSSTGSSTPASILRAFHTIPFSASDGSCPPSAQAAAPTPVARSVPRPYKKRSISTDSAAMVDETVFYTGLPAKPPKNPRSVSYSADLPRAAVTPSWSGTTNLPAPLSLSLINTPRGKKASTVTPASYSSCLEGSTSSGGRTVRFARSNSVCSTDGACTETDDSPQDPHQYLWDRSACAQGSPQVQASNSTPLHYYVPGSSRTPSSVSTSQADLTSQSTLSLFGYPSSSDADKENILSPEKSRAVDAISLLRHSCARLFSEAVYRDTDSHAEEVPVVSPAVSEAPDFCHDGSSQGSQGSTGSAKGEYCLATPGSHCKNLRRLHSTESSFSPPAVTLSAMSEHEYVPNTSSISTSSLSTSAPLEDVARSETDQIEERIKSPARRQWEWDPSLNPLMHLAMITEHI